MKDKLICLTNCVVTARANLRTPDMDGHGLRVARNALDQAFKLIPEVIAAWNRRAGDEG